MKKIEKEVKADKISDTLWKNVFVRFKDSPYVYFRTIRDARVIYILKNLEKT